MRDTLRNALTDALGPVDSLEPVGGGSINRAAVAHTDDGSYFVKWNDGGAPDDLFLREEEALRAMADAAPSLVVPEPIAASRPQGDRPGFLIMEYLPPGDRVDDFDERLGRGLAELHGASADGFGFEHDNYCGTTPQPNDWMEGWIDFYREQRLGHQVELAADGHGLSLEDRRLFERLLENLDDLLVGGAPSLIHGDLWHGNLHVAPDGRPALIDPAAYYGHPEAEIGMMELFGGFSDRVYRAYEEVAELPDGWRDRVPLYSLYHVLNHYNLFGGHWRGRAVDIASRHVD